MARLPSHLFILSQKGTFMRHKKRSSPPRISNRQSRTFLSYYRLRYKGLCRSITSSLRRAGLYRPRKYLGEKMKPERTEKPWPRQIWEAHRLLVTCAVISSVLLVVFSALQMSGSPILNLSVQWILVAGVPLLVALVADGYIRDIKIHRFEVGINQTRQNVESAVETRELRSEGGDEIPGKFENMKPYIDWAEIS